MSASSGRRPARDHRGRPATEPVRVMIVDGEARLTGLLSMAMRHEGWEVRSTDDEMHAGQIAQEFRPDSIFVTLTQSDADGLEVLGKIHSDAPDVPVLLLTHQDTPPRRIAGITAGYDDYLKQPFSLEEMLARLRTLMRRAGRDSAPDPLLVVGDLTLNEETHEVRRGDDDVYLSVTEFELLRYLMRNPRRAMSKAQILDRVWHYEFNGHSNIVQMYISYLRKKIDTGHPPMIHTLHGVGYVLRP